MSLRANSRSCVIEIGGVPIGIHAFHTEFMDSVEERYVGFLSSSPAEINLEIQISDQRPVTDANVRVQREGSKWAFSRGDFRADWDPDQRQGVVHQGASPYALDSALRIMHSLLLADSGGFLLHSASAICGEDADRWETTAPSNGRAFLFSGVSGAGKTTITRLAPTRVTLLSDEISYVRPTADGSYRAFGTPFSGELAKPGENCSAPIAALFFLEQGQENQIQELPPSEAVHKLMRNILFFAEDRRLIENLFATASDFVQKVPVRRLTFYPDSRVWDEVRNFDRMPEHV